MGRFLIVSKTDSLREYRQIAKEYQVGFEINDFFVPDILDNVKEQKRRIDMYLAEGIPNNSTIHGAFFDIVAFSPDSRIRSISVERMRQSLDIASRLGVRGVVFHTNVNPMLTSSEYNRGVVKGTVKCLGELLRQYPDIDIYLENMFDASPDILLRISERLNEYGNYGVCLDYAHAVISGYSIDKWIKRLAPYIRHIHINDCDLKHDLHLALGQGKIDWKQFFSYYYAYFTDCSVLIETTEPKNQRASLEFLLGNNIL